MFHITDDERISGYRPLISPAILMEEIPVSEKASNTVANARQAVEAIINGNDDRLLVVAGPCSIHDTKAALEYADRLHGLMRELDGELFIVMRVYFEKPRTTIGWKGLINDPHLDGSFDINNGLRAARGLLLELAHRGIPSGSEFLDVITPQFVADLRSLGCDRRTNDGEPDSPRIGVRFIHANRFQEWHRREHTDCGGCDRRCASSAPFSIRDQAEHCRHRHDPWQRCLPSDHAGIQFSSQLQCDSAGERRGPDCARLDCATASWWTAVTATVARIICASRRWSAISAVKSPQARISLRASCSKVT